MGNFVHVNNYVLKAEHTPDLEPAVVAMLRASAGLVCLESREYAKVGCEYQPCGGYRVKKWKGKVLFVRFSVYLFAPVREGK